jgi:hypothetical protein
LFLECNPVIGQQRQEEEEEAMIGLLQQQVPPLGHKAEREDCDIVLVAAFSSNCSDDDD